MTLVTTTADFSFLTDRLDRIEANQQELLRRTQPAAPIPNPVREPVMKIDLQDNALGPYQLADWRRDWNNPGNPWKPLTFLSVVENAGDKVLKFDYLQGKYGSLGGGSNFNGILPKTLEHATLSYEIFFEEGFDYGLGGKMIGFRNTPSLSGGNASAMAQSTGFSGRMMWNEYRKMKLYFYSQGMPGPYGWDLKAGEFGDLKPSVWHQIELEIKMNTVGKADGIVIAKQNGVVLARVENVVLRTASSPQKITELYVDTFMGGNDSQWAPDHNQFALMKNFKVFENS